MRFAIHIVCIIIALASGTRPSLAQCDPTWLPGDGFVGFNNTVNCLTSWTPPVPGASPELIAVGKYSIAGNTAINGISSWNGSSWNAIGSLPLSDMTAATVVNGVLYVSTGYTIWKFDGANWQSIGVASSGAVRAMIEWNGALVVAGEFSSFAGIPTTRVAVWNGTTWTGLSGMTTGGVQALAVFNGELYAGGTFSTADPVVSGLARWDGAAWKRLQTNGFTGQVNALLATPSELIVGGFFNVPGNSSSKNIASWNGTSWTSYDLGINSRIYSLAVFRGSLVASTQSPALAVMRWNGSTWSKVSPDFISGITSILAFNDRLYVAGTFSNIGTIRADCIAEWDGETWISLGQGGLDASSKCSTVFQGNLIVGGRLRFVGSTPIQGLARWNGISWSAFPSNFYSVTALHAHDSSLFAAVDSNPQKRCYMWNGSEWLAISEPFTLTGSTAQINAITTFRGDLIVTGKFDAVGSIAANNIARWDGSAWHPLTTGLARTAGNCTDLVGNALFVHNDRLIVGGAFNLAGGVSASAIAQWDGQAWSPIGIGFTSPTCAPRVNVITEINGQLIVGGDLGSSGANTISNLAVWNGSAWERFSSLNSGAESISSIQELNGEVFVGGQYSQSLSILYPLVRWNGTSWSNFGTEVTSSVSWLQRQGNELIVGGNFEIINNAANAYFARYSTSLTSWTALPPSDSNIQSGATLELSSTPASGYSDVTFRWQRNGIDIHDGPNGASPAGGTVSGASGNLPSPTDGTPALLTITDAQPSDSGQYTITFSNSCGDSTSVPASVTVHAPCPADLNHDFLVDDADFSIFAVAYNILDCADPTMPAGCLADLNADELVDDADFSIFLQAYNEFLCP